ncbi:hypothetical protein BX666DRAFT_1991675 [Dichotomocladium elegans]|nr:hypothetical protein BX666DRAFT_1991675 [Dichotomocladium elegans]
MANSLIPSEYQEFNGTAPYTVDLGNDESELWLIRVPENVTEEQLKNIKIPIPMSDKEQNDDSDDEDEEEDDEEEEAKALATISDNKGSTYSLYKVPDNVDNGIGGQEMAGLTVMLPANGKLAFASKPVKKYFVLDEEINVPDSREAAEAILAKPLIPRPQPEGLKMRFKPYGFDTGAPTTQPEKEPKKRKREHEKEKKEKKKKSKKTSA